METRKKMLDLYGYFEEDEYDREEAERVKRQQRKEEEAKESEIKESAEDGPDAEQEAILNENS